MHIAEGILTGTTMASTTAVGVGLVAWGAWSMGRFTKDSPERKPLLGMAGAFIFLVSLIPIPAFSGTTSHPCGTPLAGILLGPGAAAALAFLSLLLQAAFFAHGGFSSLGANTITLGLMGAGAGWLAFKSARKMGVSIFWSAALGGLAGDLATYAGAGLMLSWHLAFFAPEPKFSFAGYLGAIYLAYLPTQSWIAVGEMLVTGFALKKIAAQRPELLRNLGVDNLGDAKSSRALVSLLWVAGLMLLGGTLSAMTGMDEVVNEKVAEGAGAAARDPFLNTEAMGDLWNTLLLGAGGAAGFVIGRWWHLLFGKAEAGKKPAGKKGRGR